MLEKLILFLGFTLAFIIPGTTSYAGTLVFEAEEEEEIIIVEEEPTLSHGFDFDLTALGTDTAIAASIILDLRDNDSEAELASIIIEDFVGTWGASSGSPAPGFASGPLSVQVLSVINQSQMLHVEIESTQGDFSYFGSTLIVTTLEVPEPSSIGLLIMGLSAACFRFSRKQDR